MEVDISQTDSELEKFNARVWIGVGKKYYDVPAHVVVARKKVPHGFVVAVKEKNGIKIHMSDLNIFTELKEPARPGCWRRGTARSLCSRSRNAA